MPCSPNPSGRAILTKKAPAAGVKSITLKERRWKLYSDIRTLRTSTAFCLKGPLGRSPIDRVKRRNFIHLAMYVFELPYTPYTDCCTKRCDFSFSSRIEGSLKC
ncbi:hypothetical protein AVEN_117311-1 [Araneus ventricosus]|uniref:Uncharacterized protein n=1 Tax=Araneus ventricosus TaxID=182803 RepID=A0A4Y2HJE9_ARAVE|nr:hypothetical protein AVEN_117311-1 [Araneus ventricosus]